jgi:glycosyltransferase involved in cell wall biosynthesis
VRLLFASGKAYLPDRVDGAILSTHTLLSKLASAGHACEAVAGIATANRRRAAVYRLRRLATGRRTLGWPDRDNGYPTWRAWEGLVPELVRERIGAFRPQIVMTQLERAEQIARTALDAGVPAAVYIRDAEFLWLRGGLPDDERLLLLACSEFVRTRVRERLGREAHVVHPVVDLERYRATERRPRYITLVNPARKKGVGVVLDVARRLPHREFLLLETWVLPDEEREQLLREVAELPNVTLRGRTLDMRSVYAETALLLVPSQWEEAFGRVVLEAQVNAIPVVASRIGGLADAVGEGGMLLPPDAPGSAWAEAVEGIMSDTETQNTLGRAALANTGRPEFAAAGICERFVSVVEAHLAAVPA